MIEEIKFKNVATFEEECRIDSLRKINFFYGGNGTGKTTISKLLSHPQNFDECDIKWINQTGLETFVYNRDFADEVLTEQKGIFTLGKDASDDIKQIDRLNSEQTSIQTKLENLEARRDEKDEQLIEAGNKFEDYLWQIKKKYLDKFDSNILKEEGFAGHIGTKIRFKDKINAEKKSNSYELLTLQELEEKIKTIFSQNLQIVNNVENLEIGKILEYEQAPILKKKVVGKEDVNISAMISKLNNSDWVNRGRQYFENNDGICPFCQQETSEIFRKNLSEYFDETFTEDSKRIQVLINNYDDISTNIHNQLQYLEKSHPFLDIDELKNQIEAFNLLIAYNKQQLREKSDQSSRIVELKSSANILSTIQTIIDNANKDINENNIIVNNLKNEKKTLIGEIWQFLVFESEKYIQDYQQTINPLNKAISSIKDKIKDLEKTKRENTTELNKLEKEKTSIVPTRDKINAILNSFGFRSFKIALGEKTNTYKLVRENEDCSPETLSEGEKNFITFLYFYFLLEGSHSETNISTDRIVVIDDPVSSLDNEVLFIVSTLVRKLIKSVIDENSPIKQIFVLTHNIYFHKEITYDSKNRLNNKVTYWLVKKNYSTSYVEYCDKNPIKTSYDLLWQEVRSKDRNPATIQNVLRRILENYFKLLGGIPLDELYKKFEGEEKIICQALCSWVHDGSHGAFHEDFNTQLDDEVINKFLYVFEKIFINEKHEAHYKMMMKQAE